MHEKDFDIATYCGYLIDTKNRRVVRYDPSGATNPEQVNTAIVYEIERHYKRKPWRVLL